MAYQLILDQPGDPLYQGKAERCTYEFSCLPEQVPGEQWLAQRIIDATNQKLLEANSRLLHLKVWRDMAPTWTTNYRVEVTASASPLFWGVIVLGILTIVVLFLTWRILSVVKDIDWGKVVKPVVTGTIAVVAVALGVGLLLLASRKSPT